MDCEEFWLLLRFRPIDQRVKLGVLDLTLSYPLDLEAQQQSVWPRLPLKANAHNLSAVLQSESVLVWTGPAERSLVFHTGGGI